MRYARRGRGIDWRKGRLPQRPANVKGSAIEIYVVIDQVTFDPCDQDGPWPNSVRPHFWCIHASRPDVQRIFSEARARVFLFSWRSGSGRGCPKRLETAQSSGRNGAKLVGFAFYWVPNPRDPGGNPLKQVYFASHPGARLKPPSAATERNAEAGTEVFVTLATENDEEE